MFDEKDKINYLIEIEEKEVKKPEQKEYTDNIN
jgi:hypothetical protein